ncbi:hypothetical protein [Flavobacterium daejeonense]|uniref:hypothetical protein n=1 Tax=Flavobacterium daejeonense TaxID=350893 RepID=UPI00047E99D9|nr:hypothetical protein [Flavobacterium daejeonense]
MKNKAKLAFELLEQEMEVIYKEELMQFIGGSGGYTWQQFVDAVMSGNLSGISSGTYSSSDGFNWSSYSSGGYGSYVVNGVTFVWSSEFSIWMEQLNEVSVGSTGWTGNWIENYIGPNNPYGYTLAPANMADFFAMVHDLDYDALNAQGVGGVLVDMNTLSADLRLIMNEIQVSQGQYGSDIMTRLEALAVATGISVGVLIKMGINGAASIQN